MNNKNSDCENAIFHDNVVSIERIEPNKDVIEMTKMVLAQNEQILKMNERLLTILSSPMMIVSGKQDTINA